MANTSTKTNRQVVKQIVAILAIVTLLFTVATPEAAQAKTGGSLLALLGNLTGTSSAEAASSEETASFPVSEDRDPVKVITVVVTAYNSVPGQTDSTPCITANGHDLCKQYAEIGTGDSIAANGLKFGTRVRFPEIYGDKEFVVRDRMNARYGADRVDVWLPTVAESKVFGVKRVKMEIYN